MSALLHLSQYAQLQVELQHLQGKQKEMHEELLEYVTCTCNSNESTVSCCCVRL